MKCVVKCDIDNVLNNLVECMFGIYNEEHEDKLSYDDCVEYDFSCFNSEQYLKLYDMFSNKKMWDNCKPKSNAVSYLKKMNDEFDLIIVTATDVCNFEWKVEWMKKFFPFIKEEQIWRDDGVHRRRIWTDFSIDDYHENLNNDLGYRILINAPWNKNIKSGFDCRVNDLKEAYECIIKSLKEGVV